MRILLVDSGRVFRGGQRQVAYLARGLRERGHDVVAMVTPRSPLAAELRDAGVTVVPCRQRSDLDFCGAALVWRTAARVRPDVVHAQDARSHTMARLAQVAGLRPPLVVTRRVTFPPRTAWKYRRGVRRYVAVSWAVRRALIAARVPARTIDVVFSAIPSPPPNEPVADLRSLGVAPGRFVCVALGALTPEKGFDVLVQAAARLARADLPAEWLVLGQGPLAQDLQARAHAIGVPVSFVGQREDFGPILRAADLLVHPARAEGLGTALLEALARGLPVVGTRVGGISELLSPVVGTLVPPDDPDGLANAVSHWLRDPARRRAVRQHGPQRAAEFSIHRMVEGNLRTYAAALS